MTSNGTLWVTPSITSNVLSFWGIHNGLNAVTVYAHSSYTNALCLRDDINGATSGSKWGVRWFMLNS